MVLSSPPAVTWNVRPCPAGPCTEPATYRNVKLEDNFHPIALWETAMMWLVLQNHTTLHQMSLRMSYLHLTLHYKSSYVKWWSDTADLTIQWFSKAQRSFHWFSPSVLDMYWTSLYLVPCPSWWCLSGYGACVPTTPTVPAVSQRKLGTQASGAVLEESTSLPSLLPYKVLWCPVCCWICCRDKTHLNTDSGSWTCHCHCLYDKKGDTVDN